ncbi:MAG: efflux RND transporter periplasmic adaptor subunit [Methylocystis sp.]
MTTTERQSEKTAPRQPRLKRGLAIAALVALALAAAGVFIRNKDFKQLAEATKEGAIPTVAVGAPQAGPAVEEIILPGNVQSFFDARIRARVQGFVRDWRYDIGAKVKAGDVLATVEAPELDQQLQQAKGELSRAEAEVNLAKLTSKRWSALRASTAVSQQSADEKSGDYQAKVAATEAARANVERLRALTGYLQITSPFAGVVTARNVDIGALVGPENKLELFSVADIHQVRVYVGVPQAYAASIKPGMIAELKLAQFPTRLFTAKVLTTSNAIAENSRSLLVQLIADNPEGLLLPGSYAEVHFKLPGRPGVRRIPASAIFFQKNALAVATVGANSKVAIKPITIVRDLGTTIEISSGPALSDRIILNPPQSLSDGDEVRIAEGQAGANAGAQ